MLMANQKCTHCDEPVIQDHPLEEGEQTKHFCCGGCRSVYKILKANGLDNYYALKAGEKSLGPVELNQDKFSYLDEKEFQKKYYQKTEHGYRFKFFIEGVHCVACLWLLEKLSDLGIGVIKSQLNMSSAVLDIEFHEDAFLATIARQIASFGYRPHPLLEESDLNTHTHSEDRKSLIRIGVAFACMGNIMLYAFSVYAGADGLFKNYFHLFSLVCALPVFFYSAIPFYKNAFYSLKNKEPSIDVPIVVAILVGFGMGVYSLLLNKNYFYFDTLTTLVFLLLLARFILKKMQQRSLRSQDLTYLFATKTANKIVGGEETEVLTTFLKIGDHVKVKAGETIPIDGKILEGKSHVNNSLLTGEVKPVAVSQNDLIYMGAQNLTSGFVLEVTSQFNETRLGKILREIEEGWKSESRLSLLTDKISKRFVYFVFSLAALFFTYFGLTAGLEVAFDRTLTLLIITCPCALALTTPLALILGMSAMARNGVIIKNEKTLEKLAQIKEIFFDKTGTLTRGEFEISLDDNSQPLEEHFNLIYSLESRSHHPIGQSFVKYCEKRGYETVLEIENFMETPGIGVSGLYQNSFYELKSYQKNDTENTTVGFYKDGDLIACFTLADQIKPNAVNLVKKLKKLGIKSSLLSGDKLSAVRKIGERLGFSAQNIFGEYTPEEKRSLIESTEHTLMVGDGINDAIALKAAYVGVAVRGSVDVSLRAADVYLSRPKVIQVFQLIKSSKQIIKVIYRNLGFSLLYNVIGIYLAATGQVSPLVAAILMPASSITVLVSTILSSRKIQSLMS